MSRNVTDFGALTPAQRDAFIQRTKDSMRMERILSGDRSALPSGVAIEHINRAKVLADAIKSSANDILSTSVDTERLVSMLRRELDSAIAALSPAAPPQLVPPPAAKKGRGGSGRKS